MVRDISSLIHCFWPLQTALSQRASDWEARLETLNGFPLIPDLDKPEMMLATTSPGVVAKKTGRIGARFLTLAARCVLRGRSAPEAGLPDAASLRPRYHFIDIPVLTGAVLFLEAGELS